MKQSPQFLRKTLRQAHSLQARYTALGAASTQNIRNPLPMHKLVLGVLPKLPDPDEIIPVVVTTHFTFHGKKFAKTHKSHEYARDLIPRDQWEKSGMTVADVMTDLQRLGYIVGSKSSVAMALSRHPKVSSVRARRLGQRGKPRSLYFITE